MRTSFICLIIVLAFIGSSNAGDCEELNDECGHRLVWSLFYSRSTPSQYDTDEFKEDVVPLLQSGWEIERSKNSLLKDLDFRYDYYPELYSVYEFDADSDFILINYSLYPRERPDGTCAPRISGWVRSILVGYVKSTDTKYILSEGYGASLVERLNQMAAGNDGTPRMSVECKVALLVGIMDPGSAIVNSWADVDAWRNGMFNCNTGDTLLDLSRFYMLYWFFPSMDSVLVRTATERSNKLDTFDEYFYESKEENRLILMMEDSIQIVKFAIREADDIIVVRFTTFHPYSPPVGMAIWEVRMTKSGFILSIQDEYFFSGWYTPIPDP